MSWLYWLPEHGETEADGKKWKRELWRLADHIDGRMPDIASQNIDHATVVLVKKVDTGEIRKLLWRSNLVINHTLSRMLNDDPT